MFVNDAQNDLDGKLKDVETTINDTLASLEDLNNSTDEQTTLYLTTEQQKNETYFHDSETGTELEVIERTQLVEYFAENYKQWGATLEFVTNRSQEGTQFVRGFGGIGGMLRWKVDFQDLEVAEEAEDEWGFDDGF